MLAAERPFGAADFARAPGQAQWKGIGASCIPERNPPGVAVIELRRATDRLPVHYIHPGCDRHATIFAFATSRGKEPAGHAKHTPPYAQRDLPG